MTKLTRRSLLKLGMGMGIIPLVGILSLDTDSPFTEIAQLALEEDEWGRVLCWIDKKPLRGVCNVRLTQTIPVFDTGEYEECSWEINLDGDCSRANTELLDSLQEGGWYDVVVGTPRYPKRVASTKRPGDWVIERIEIRLNEKYIPDDEKRFYIRCKRDGGTLTTIPSDEWFDSINEI